MIAPIQEDEPLKADGFNEAIIGQDYEMGRYVYSIERILEILMLRDDMTMDDAMEFFNFNIAGAYVGKMTPLYIWTGDTQ
jgi:hypothetical protein